MVGHNTRTGYRGRRDRGGGGAALNVFMLLSKCVVLDLWILSLKLERFSGGVGVGSGGWMWGLGRNGGEGGY